MREKRNILISIGLGVILGWTLGFLRLPYLEKNNSFLLGFIACLSIVFSGLLIISVWKKNILFFGKNASSSSTLKKNTLLTILTLSLILMGGFTSSFLFFQQKKFTEIQAQSKHKKLAAQFELEATARKSNALILINNLLNKIDTELKSHPEQILSEEIIDRISALNYSFKPYQYFDGEKFLEKKWSPERGQLLLGLAKMNIDSTSFSLIKSKTSFLGADLKGANLSGADLSGVDLREANLDDVNFEKANLKQAKLKDAILQNANFQKAKLNNADLRNTDLRWANFDQGNLFQANFNGANLTSAKLREVDAQGADFGWADMIGVILNQANLTKADLWGTNLSRANLSEVNFSEANLTNTNFTEANLNKANLTQVNLTIAVVNDDQWFEKLMEWQVVGAKEVQEKYKYEVGKTGVFKFRLRKK